METAPTTGITTVYSHPECGYCTLLTEDFDSKGIEYTEIDLSKQPELWPVVEGLTGGDRITPVTVMADGEVQVGYNGIGCNFS